MQLDEPLCGMIFAGIFERHPRLKLVLGESGLGWIPYLLERMDHEYAKYNPLAEDVSLPDRPSEYFRRNVLVTYEQDDLGLDLIDRIGAANVMWASDYPHGDSTWPHSREAIRTSKLSALDESSRRRIVCENAAQLYQIK